MRILLFIAMQVAILVVVSIVGSILMNVFGIRMNGGSMIGLLVMCAVFGFTGSIISLFTSKWMCKKAYGVRVIEQPMNGQEQFLVQTIADLSRKAGFKMPEVGIYESNDINAFATGASKDAALVAVSSALLERMSEREVKGVLGHEISHIANGDMVTMSLLQGVLNTFVYFFAHIAASVVSNFMSSSDDEESESSSQGNPFVFFIVNTIFQVLFGFIAQIILMWFSRYREYRADAGSAELESKQCMIEALEALRRTGPAQVQQEGQMQALCINGGISVSELFMSHPPLEKRIAALRSAN